MLLIFDLDDTLIDTSGCIVPLKLRDALQVMVKAGLGVGDFDAALARLKQINAGSASGREGIRKFLEEVHGLEFLNIGLGEYYGNIKGDFSVSMVDDAERILEDLARRHTLALVTEGDLRQQRLKMRKAGVNPDLFAKIVVSPSPNKKPHYEAIIREFGRDEGVLVCGDRVATDLVPGHELGCVTVQVLWGRGGKSDGFIPDYQITHFNEFYAIVEGVACRQ